MAVTLSARLEMELDGFEGGWTDVRSDVLNSGRVRLRGGLRGDGPTERLGASGSMTFTLNNSPSNSLGLMGAYSPDHANKRAGFAVGIRCRLIASRNGIAVASSSVANPSVITTSAPHYLVTGETVTIAAHSGSTPSVDGEHEVTVISPTTFSIPVNVTVGGTGGTASIGYTQFVGRITGLSPAPSFGGTHGTAVTVSDWLKIAAKTKLSGLEVRDSVRGDELVQAVIDSMANQPEGVDLDEGVDTYAFAFDSLGGNAMAELSRILRSGYDIGFVSREGVFRYENRNYRFVHNVTPDIRLDGDMIEMAPDQDVDRVINRIVGVAHPRSVDSAFSVLYSKDDKPFVAPGETVTLKGKWIDPHNQGEKIGAVDAQEPVPGLDYSMDTVQAESVGSADTPATLRPEGTGFYNSFSGSVADVADDSDSTGMAPSGGVIYHTFTMGRLPGTVPDNAAIVSVRTIVRVLNPLDLPHFTNWYWRIRYNGIDLDGMSLVPPVLSSTGGAGFPGAFEFFCDWPNPPGGGTWNAGVINALEVGGAFNWDSATPALLSLKLTCIYASQVASTDRTSSFTMVDFRPAGDGFEIDFRNDGIDGAYITKLQVRGRRLTSYTESEVLAIDEDSIDAYGQSELSYDMPYQGDSTITQLLIDYILRYYKDPRTFLPSITVRGDRGGEFLAAVLRCDVSSLVAVAEEVTGIDARYFINGVEKTFGDNMIVIAKWLLAPAEQTDFWTLDDDTLDDTTIVSPL